jgi:hypothetical protein
MINWRNSFKLPSFFTSKSLLILTELFKDSSDFQQRSLFFNKIKIKQCWTRVWTQERKTTTEQKERSAHAPSNVVREHQVSSSNRIIIAMSNINWIHWTSCFFSSLTRRHVDYTQKRNWKRTSNAKENTGKKVTTTKEETRQKVISRVHRRIIHRLMRKEGGEKHTHIHVGD